MKSKFFCVAVEGTTTDGRKIERKWLEQIAANYNAAKYGARVFIEHIRGLNPEWGFRCMGDVIAVKTGDVEIDGEKRLGLFAQIKPTDEMLALNKAGQKIYSSIEVNPDFAGSGEAYLVGLGVTDSPASLGTEVLAFAAQNPAANPFAARKQAPENLFSAAMLSEIEFEDDKSDQPSLLERITALFSRRQATDDQRFADVHAAVEHVANAVADASARATGEADTLREAFSALKAELDEQKAAHDEAFAALTARLDNAPAGTPPRPHATGGGGQVLTDC